MLLFSNAAFARRRDAQKRTEICQLLVGPNLAVDLQL
jgi:hypothetical protein